MTTLIPKFDLKNGGSTPTGAVNRPIDQKLSEIISVKDFGAVGDGVADDTVAIQNTIAYAQSVTKAGNSGIYGTGGVYAGTAPTVFFPSGVYKVTSALTADVAQTVNYLSFVGESSMIVASAGVTVFGGIGYQVKFEGLTFRNGACAISIKTNNVDTDMINVNLCEFNEQTTACIQTDATSYSTQLNVTNCKFYNSATSGYIGYFGTGEIYISSSWIYCGSLVAFYNNNNLTLTDIVGVPDGDLVDVAKLGHWITNYGNLHCTRVRFGGESGGAPLIYNYANLLNISTFPWIANIISIEDCAVSTGASPRTDVGFIVAKDGLPAIINITSCVGPVSSYFINDKTVAGLETWVASVEATTNRPCFTINIFNTDTRSTVFTSSNSLTSALYPYLTGELTGLDTTENTLYLPVIIPQKISSVNYPQTSTVSTTSIVDTGIKYNTFGIGYGTTAIYEIYITGNISSGGSSSYQSPLVGTLVVGTSFAGGVASQEIFYSDLYKPTFTTTGSFTVTAVFWNGTTETSYVASGTTNAQIRIKVAGYAGTVGSNQQVLITKRL